VRRIAVFLAATLALPCIGKETPLDLATIMADPDWLGQPVQSPYWSADGHSLYYRLKRDGSALLDLHRIDLRSGKDTRLDATDRAQAEGAPVFDRERRRVAFHLDGHIHLKDLASGRRTRITTEPQAESALQFSADGRALQFRMGQDWYRYDIAEGTHRPVAMLKFASDPGDAAADPLAERQQALFATLRAGASAQKEQRDETARLAAAAALRQK